MTVHLVLFIKNYLVNKNIKFTEKNIKNQKYKNEMMDYDAFATPFYFA